MAELTRLPGGGAGLIHFLDNALAPRLLGFLADHPPGIPWYGFARITAHLTDLDFVRRLKKAGCRMLKLGVESGDQAVLDALNKGTDLDMVTMALQTLHQAGIATYVYLLFGTPAEDEAAAERTLDFTLAHAGCIDFLNLAIFNLPAHSREAAGLSTLDFYAGDLSLYREFTHPRGWNRDRVRRFLAGWFKRPAPIRAILSHDPPFFTSNHAPFFAQPQNRQAATVGP
ncbi:radical SAM protein [Desulfosarcina cetonica]|uniref:radical SAM protein n=1 Tax=Desulfosarcina cetonica TaxID=90730 RepID=UPI001FED348C|nr:radical SAM protein [Desulfosarcina cetonica]